MLAVAALLMIAFLFARFTQLSLAISSSNLPDAAAQIGRIRFNSITLWELVLFMVLVAMTSMIWRVL